MGVKLYDDALLAKLNKWTSGTHLTVTSVDETKRLFEVIADTTNDKPIKLPIIALSRNGGYKILNKNKQPRTYDGALMQVTADSGVKLNQIPIGISYQIDIYTRYLEEADEYARNLIFNIINYPKLNVIIPYEDRGITHDANIRIISDVEDNSSIPERLIPGQFSRLTLGVDIDDAYLWDVRVRQNLSIVEGHVDIRDGESFDKELIFKK